MKINKDRAYFVDDYGKIKKFTITDIGNNNMVYGYLTGENKVCAVNTLCLQDNPEKLKKKYRNSIRYYKKFPNKRIGILNQDFFHTLNKKIKKEVVILNIDRHAKNTSGCLVQFINSDGIIEFADISWFENLK